MAEKLDIPMNTFPQVTDTEYIYGELADGSQIKIKVKDLLISLFQGRGNVSSNIDNYTNTGFYGINSSIYEPGVIAFGMLIVFNGFSSADAGGGKPVVQIAIGYYPNVEVKVRIRWQSNWSVWKSVVVS